MSLSLLPLLLHAGGGARTRAGQLAGGHNAAGRTGVAQESVEARAQPLSDAERIARLQRTVDESRAQLDGLRASWTTPKENTRRPNGIHLLDRELEQERKSQDQPRRRG
jgi:hypothetical protein